MMGMEDMSVDASKASQPRSWTANDEPNTHRFAVLFWVLVAIGLTLLILWYFWPVPKSQVFAATIDITDYEAPFPTPRYGAWRLPESDTPGINEYLQLDKKGLLAWNELLRGQSWNNRLELNEIHQKIRESCNKSNLSMSDKDTLLLHLRCLAAVYPTDNQGTADNSNQEFELGIVAGEKGSMQERSFRIQDLFEDLCELPVRDVVILADICDLERLPEEGLISNPIASYAKKSLELALEDLRPRLREKGPRIWFVCSANDSQPSFYSDKLQQTLFEHCVLHSLKPPNRQFLSLADFYRDFRDSLLKLSGNLQTPVIMLLDPTQKSVLQSGELTPEMKRIATDTVMALQGSGIESLPEKAKSLKAASLTQVAFHRASPQDPSSPAKSSPSTTPNAPKDDQTSMNRKVDFLKLNFWELRDYIRYRKHSHGESDFRPTWSPADFAPALWRREQLRWASLHKKVDEPPERRLQDLAKLIFSNSASSEIKDYEAAWTSFRDDPFQRLWENPQSEALWPKFASYADCVSEVLLWRDLILDLPDNSNDIELAKKDFEKLLKALTEAKRTLPYSDEGKYGKWSDFAVENAIDSQRSLRQWLQQKVIELGEKRTLDWVTERRFQVLLQSPLLTAEQRKMLLESYENFPEDSAQFESTRSESLTFVDRASLFRDTMDMILGDLLGSDSRGAKPAILQWGPWYRNQLQNLARTSDDNGNDDKYQRSSLMRWHLATLTDVDASINNSLLLPPADPMSIRLKLSGNSTIDLAESSSQKKQVQLEVKRLASTAPLDDCELTLLESDPSIRIRSIAPSLPKELVAGKPNSIGRSGQLTLQLDAANPKLPPSGVRNVSISIRCGSYSDTLKIQVVHNSRQLELVVLDRDNIPCKQSLSENGSVAKVSLSSLAIAGTSRSFRFALFNKLGSGTKREATVEAYYLKDLDPSQVPSQAELISLTRKSQLKIAASTKLAIEQETTPVVWDKPQPLPELAVNRAHLLLIITEWNGDKRLDENCLIAEFAPIKPLELVSKEILKINPTLSNEHVELEFSITEDRFWREFIGDKKELKVEVTALNSQDAIIKKEFLVLNEKKASGKFEMDVREDVRFDIAVGDFPRTKYYRYRDVDKETPRDVSPSINRFDPSKPIVASLSDTTIDIKLLESLLQPEPIDPKQKPPKPRVYLPNYIHPAKFMEQPPVPKKLEYRSLVIRTKVDLLPGHSAKLDFINANGDTELSLSSEVDRSYWSSISFDGTMQIGYRAEELQFDVTNLLRNVRDGEEQKYRVELSGSDDPDQLEIVRDLKEPEVSRIRSKKRGVFPIEIEVKAGQDLSGVSRCIVGIGNPGPAKKSFGASDQKSVPRYFSIQSDLTLLKLPAADFADLRLSVGDRVPLFLRTIDQCGNYQDMISEPLEIDWPGENASAENPVK